MKDVSFWVQSGQMFAIVGPTGAGKTTLMNLLLRFYDVNGGSIKIDGIDIRDMDRSDLRSLFSLVLQDTWLFSGSIFENIRYGSLTARKDEVVDAAKMANIPLNIMKQAKRTYVLTTQRSISLERMFVN